ncbi:nickel pincer cofactor biosynthesis protein LarC [Acidobacteriota bacterium]
MVTCYFDCSAGISGDMILGAAIDLGVERDRLIEKLKSLGLSGWELDVRDVMRSGMRACKATVRLTQEHREHRGLSDIMTIVNSGALSCGTKERAASIFKRLVGVEAGIHGIAEDQVHLHEVGAIDAIVDVVGAMIAFDELGIERFCASALRLGHGRVKAAHGELPVPAPATLELLAGKPVFGGEHEGEFTTPTGAAIVTTLCESFGPLPPLKPIRIGYGAGNRDPQGLPNVLRLILGEEVAESSSAALETVDLIEATLDDMNPELYGHLYETLFEAGALEVYLCPVQMKKNRPGTLLAVLVRPDDADLVRTKIFEETTTLGVRYKRMEREILERREIGIKTVYGEIRIKEGLKDGNVINFAPEYEDCRRAAQDHGAPLKAVYAAAIGAYLTVKV